MYKLVFRGGVFSIDTEDNLVGYARRVLEQRYKRVTLRDGVFYGDGERAATLEKWRS